MSDVIRFLELLACSTRPFDPGAAASAIQQLDAGVRAPILDRDPVALARALGQDVYACMIATPENDEPAPAEGPGDDDAREGDGDADQRAA